MTNQPSLDHEATPLTIPVWDVLRMAMIRDQFKIMFDTNGYLAEINGLEPDIRRLRLLVELMASTGYIHDREPMSLHAFFAMYDAALAPDILIALQEAGLSQRARVFAEALAAFGPTFPIDHKQRARAFALSIMNLDEKPYDPAAPPTQVDIKLHALDGAFGTNAELKRDIEDYVAKSPDLVAFTAQARANLGDDHRMSYLLSQLFSKLDGFAQPGAIQRQLDDLPAPYRTVVLLSIFMGEIVNGGMEQFFSNSSGAYAPNVAAELRALGQTAAADAVARGMALFPAPYPIETNARRLMNDDARNVQLDALTVVVDVGAIHQAVVAFAARADWLPR